MTKRKKKKFSHMKVQSVEGEKPIPQAFFRKIGITPLSSGADMKGEFVMNEIRKNKNKGDYETFTAIRGDIYKTFDFMHSKVDLAKIWNRSCFHDTCLVAEALSKISIPEQANILDVGGGVGVLAFFMAELWRDSRITVADKFSNVGSQFASELGFTHITFVKSLLPNLPDVKDHEYDVVILSRVLGFIKDLNVPSTMESTWDNYCISQEGQHLLEELGNIADGLNRVLKQDGMIVVVDSWSADRALIIGSAFESKGLLINLEMFNPDEVGIEYSAVVFTKCIANKIISDLPLALSTNIQFHGGAELFGVAADGLQKIFNSKPFMESRLLYKEKNATVKTELYEKNGLCLAYYTNSNGPRRALIFSSANIPACIKRIISEEQLIIKEGKDEIILPVTFY